MLNNFRTYKLAVEFYKTSKHIPLPSSLRDQWARASSSVAMNLAEGYGKITKPDKARFYRISLGSLRECQCILDLIDDANPSIINMADQLGGSLYRLIQATR